MYLATNFEVLYDAAVHFSLDEDGEPIWSYTGLQDEALYEIADKMRHTEPGDYLTYIKHWLAFQERFAELQPAIPIYSNVYFDFYTSLLQNYNISSNVSWGAGGRRTCGRDCRVKPEIRKDCLAGSLFLLSSEHRSQ